MAASSSITFTSGGNIYSPKNKDVAFTTNKTGNTSSISISEAGHLGNIHHVNQRRDRNSERERKHNQARCHNDGIARQAADTHANDNARRCKSEPYRHNTNMDIRANGVYDKIQKKKQSRARSAPARYAELNSNDSIKNGSHRSNNSSSSSSNDSQFSVSIHDESKLTDTSNLPPNWIAIEDPVSGDTYYANEVTKESTWDKPVMSDIPQSLQDETRNKNVKVDLLDRRYDHRPKQDVPSESKSKMSNLAHHLETIQESGSALTREELKHLHVRHHSEIISKIPGINLFIRPFEELTTSKNEKMLSDMESRIMDRLEGITDMERRIMNRLDGIDKRLDVIESKLKEEGNL